MEKDLDGNEVIVEIPGGGKNSNSSYPNPDVDDTKKQEAESYRPIPIKQVSTSAFLYPKVNSPITPRMQLTMSLREEEEEEDGDDDDDLLFNTRKRSKKMKVLCFIELCLFICITLVLILSKTMDKLKNREIWNLEFWKWCVLALAVFCGRLFSEWFSNVVLFLIEKKVVLEKNVLYFVYRRQQSFQIFIWLCLILPVWCLLINRGVHRSKDTTKILNYITRGIVSSLIVAGAWVLEVLFLHMLYSSFYVKRYYTRVQQDILNQYFLQTLSGCPLMEISVVDVQKLQKLKPKNVSARTMKELIKTVRKSAISTDSNALSVFCHDMDGPKESNITSEWGAKMAAKCIFTNVAKPGSRYIDEVDLMRFLTKDDMVTIYQLLDIGNGGMIGKRQVRNWLMNVYKDHKGLLLSLNDTRTAIEELNKFLTGFMILVLLILWLILTGIATTEVLLFISSQFLLAVFSFGNSAKSTLEAIIFVFVKRPFDVGDRCVVDGVQVVVEEMSILTTVFLRYDNEKIYYPNSLLSTKSISNFNRSPNMSDYVDFDLHVSTSVEHLAALEAKIRMYVNSQRELWHPEHSVIVREIEDGNKMKMCLYVTHTINFQNYKEKSDRRSKLMLDLKKIFEELGIKYHLLPPRSFD